jgi:filamentous hemagglutinin family protein
MKLKPYLSFLTLAISLVVGDRSARSQTYTPSNRIPVSDGTMNTQVSGSGNNFNITGGVNRGQTLFQSFTDFSVPTNGSANFLNPVGNRDIITRVTGSVFSDINGLVNTNGANFFLINPNGIVFGTNAQLNVGKAFVASTANSLDLVAAGGRTITFGTNRNGDASLLNVSPNVLFDVARLNISGGNGQISNFGILQTTNFNQYIGLIGGNVRMNGGTIQLDADDGRVDLGGLSTAGSVTLSKDINNFRAQFPTDVSRGDVSLKNNSLIYVANGNGGDIFITARNIEILGQSFVSGGIFPGFGGVDSVAGDIKVSATGDITIADNSVIFNTVGAESIGKGGAIEIAAGQNLSIANGVGLTTATLGQGEAGNLKITAAGNITFDSSNALSTVGIDAVGNGGGIEIVAGQNISFINRAGLSASTFGRGDAGNLKITATGNIAFDRSGIFSNVSGDAVGKGGGIEINGGKNISVTNGANLSASTFGRGDAGSVKLTAQENVTFDRGGALSAVDIGGIGRQKSLYCQWCGTHC